MPLRVGLVQINNSFSGQSYLPYSVGTLQAYAEAHLARKDEVEFLLPLYKRLPVEEAARRLADADVACFSTYVWNERISLQVARRLKERRPEVAIVFGGPQVPDDAAAFLRAHPFVDVAAHGEGERTFVRLLERARDRAWADLPGVSFLDAAGGLVRTAPQERLRSLDDVPSPYLEGTFAPLMAANPAERWIVLWETNRGCPFSCTFCDWGSATATKVNRFELGRLEREVEWFAARRIEFVFCADANFGLLPRDLDLARHVAATKARTGFPHALSVQNTKNSTSRAYEVQAVLARAGLNKGVALSVQSTDHDTLVAIKRDNISLDSYKELQRRFTRDGIETYSDLILGLPGETYESFARGLGELLEGGQHNRIQFNNLSILPNAEMARPEYRARWGLETVETAIINIHGALVDDEVQERQELVIATASMPRADWVRARALAWMAALLHFDKVLQLPLTLVREVAGVSWRDLLEHLASPAVDARPALGAVRRAFLDKARDIQAGGPEYCESREWLGIWWPADEHVLIDLCAGGRLDAFYDDCEGALEELLRARGQALPPGLLRDAIRLNRALLKRPGQTTDLELELEHNVLEVHRGALRGEPQPLERRPTRYQVDRTAQRWATFDDWCREVIWYGNKKGAYLYGAAPSTTELAGHF